MKIKIDEQGNISLGRDIREKLNIKDYVEVDVEKDKVTLQKYEKNEVFVVSNGGQGFLGFHIASRAQILETFGFGLEDDTKANFLLGTIDVCIGANIIQIVSLADMENIQKFLEEGIHIYKEG